MSDDVFILPVKPEATAARIEAVAKVLCERQRFFSWHPQSEDEQDAFRAEARAVLAALGLTP